MILSRYATKVTFQIPVCIGGAKVDHHLTQVFMVSMHGLWIYDYLLTLGDEVQYPFFFDRVGFLLLYRSSTLGPGGNHGVSSPPLRLNP